MLKTLTIAAIALAAVAATTPAQAGWDNGVDVNGIKPNGQFENGVKPNGGGNNGQGTQGIPMQRTAGTIELQGITLTDGRNAGATR